MSSAGTGRGPRRFPIVLTVATLVAFCILIALGTWQVQRLKWKTDLLHRIAALQSAPAQSLQAVLARLEAGGDADYTRVQMRCPDVETRPTLQLFWPVKRHAEVHVAVRLLHR